VKNTLRKIPQFVFKAVARTKVGSATDIDDELFGTGIPSNRKLNVWISSLRSPKPLQVSQVFRVDHTGRVVEASRSDPLRLTAGGFTKGEWMEVVLISTDKSINAVAKVIPFPIEVKDGLCRAWMELGSSDRKTFILFVEGLTPNIEVNTVSRSEKETLEGKAKTSATGTFTSIVLPATIGKQSGWASYEIAEKSCQLKLDFEWGTSAS
jgi:hypothetical protein